MRLKNSQNFKKISYILSRNFFLKKKLKILEFGVDAGYSTKCFLDYCKKNNGKLYSVDTINYANLFKNSKWKFIQSRDDNFLKIKKEVKFPVDIIFLDTEHTAEHVEKIFYLYFKYLKKDGYFIIDDISWIPYLKNKKRNNEWIENNNRSTFLKLIEILTSNEKSLRLEFMFNYSGLAIVKKINNKLFKPEKIYSREYMIKNSLRKIKKLFF